MCLGTLAGDGYRTREIAFLSRSECYCQLQWSFTLKASGSYSSGCHRKDVAWVIESDGNIAGEKQAFEVDSLAHGPVELSRERKLLWVGNESGHTWLGNATHGHRLGLGLIARESECTTSSASLGGCISHRNSHTIVSLLRSNGCWGHGVALITTRLNGDGSGEIVTLDS